MKKPLTRPLDWNAVQAFWMTAESGSFSAAAKALHIAQTTVSRQVASLEAALGVSLFERMGRGIELTVNGTELIDQVRAMAAAAQQVGWIASGKSDPLSGSLRISATEAAAFFILPPLVRNMRERAPGLEIEIIASNMTSDLQRREADLAIRNYAPKEPGLTAKKLPDSQASLFATPGYLKKLNQPIDVKSLTEAVFIGFVDNVRYQKGLREIGLRIPDERFRYRSENHLVHWAWVRAGAGIGVMLDSVGARDSSVQKVLPSLPPFPVETWLVASQQLITNPRVRFAFDFLSEALLDWI